MIRGIGMIDINQEKSAFHFYSYGYVAENKRLSSDEIFVLPVEHLPLTSGALKYETEDLTVSGEDKDGKEYESVVRVSSCVTAKWLNLNSNRQTAPDIRRNERVMLLRYADTDQLYWVDMGLDHHLRKLETVRYVFSATTDENEDEVSTDNHYFIEVSTHKKLITVGTSKVNGEPFTYGIQLDTGKGKFTIEDNNDNFIHLNSGQRFFHIKNKDSSEIQLNKDSMYAYVKNKIHARADKYVHIEAPKMDFGELDRCEPSVLGEKLAAMLTKLENWENTHQHVDGFGRITSHPIVPLDISEGKTTSGNVYSKTNRNA